MATFGKQVTGGSAAPAKPTFGKKTTSSPMGRAAPAARDKLSPEALAFLNAERARVPEPESVAAQKPSFATPAYAAPSGAAGHQAGKPVWGRRIIATLIDGMVFAIPLVVIIGAMGPQPYMTDAQFATGYIAVLFFLVFGALIYAVAMENSSFQATLGKMAVGAIVTDKTGGKPSLGAVIMRNTLGKLVSGITPLYLSYLMGLVRQDCRCLHDLIAGTMVCAKGKASTSYDQTFA